MIIRLDMRLQSVEADSRRSSIPISILIFILATSDENENNFSSAIVPKRNHPDSRALESMLQRSREERLHKAGLQKEQTSIPIAQKEQASIPMVMLNPIRPIPMVILKFTDSDIITKPHLPDITYVRGATHIKKSIERQRIHQVVVVNTLTYFGTQTGIFLDLDIQKFCANICSNEHLQYDFRPQDQPSTSIRYDGKWFINKMDPSMWEFNGNRMKRGTSKEGNGQNSLLQYQNSPPQRQNPSRYPSCQCLDSSSQHQSPTTRHRYDQPQDPNGSDLNDSDNGNTDRDRRRDDRGRDDRGRDRNRNRNKPHRCGTNNERRDLSNPFDPSDSDDDDIYGCQRFRRNHDNRQNRCRDCHRDRSTQPTPIIDKSTTKLSSSMLGFFDPDKDSVHCLCDQLSLMTELYDDAAIIALLITKAIGQNKHSTVNNRKAKSIKANKKESDTVNKPRISLKEMAKAHYTLPFPDTEEIRKAFEILKARLSSAPVLIHPEFDLEFILYTDARRKEIGVGLYQVSQENDKLYPILFISRQLKDTETRYSTMKLECLGLV